MLLRDSGSVCGDYAAIYIELGPTRNYIGDQIGLSRAHQLTWQARQNFARCPEFRFYGLAHRRVVDKILHQKVPLSRTF